MRIVKILGWLVVIVIIAVGIMLAYVKYALPSIPAPDIKVEITPERVERGEYLANHVWLCMDCHSDRDWSKFSAPPVHGTMGSGGDEFTEELGFPGHYYALNITPGGIGDWTDGEIFRAITSGVTKDGRALFPIMPYPYLGKADREDIYAVIAYIRTLEPVERSYPEATSNFPMNFIINLIPSEPELRDGIDHSNKLEYGEYLAWSCVECHTVAEKGQIIPEKSFAGGRAFPLPKGGTVYSANITPDPETGIGNWTEEAFIQRFKIYGDTAYVSPAVGPNQFNSYMPWEMFSGMTESDLSAIYTFLHSLEPQKNQVTKFIPD
jgi:mono/diheme cytochrome c family protein